MGRPRKKDDDNHGGTVNGELPKPDFERAARLLRVDVRPAEEKVGEHAQTMSQAYKTIAKECHVDAQAARIIFRQMKNSPEKQDAFFRSLNGMAKEMKVGPTRSLFDEDDGFSTDDDIVAPVERAAPKLATLEGASIN